MDTHLNAGYAVTLRVIGSMCNSMADALERDDEILGSIAGMGLADHLPALPSHIRAVFMEYLSNEAARSAKADALYWAEREAEAANRSYLDRLP